MFRTRGRLNPKRWTRALSDRVRGTAFERILREARRSGRHRYVFAWNRGLGDIALGLVPLFMNIRATDPLARIEVVTREDLAQPFELARVDAIHVVPALARGTPVDVSKHEDDVTVVFADPDPTRWLEGRRQEYPPRLAWRAQWNPLADRLLGEARDVVTIGAHVASETAQYYGYVKDWPAERFRALFARYPSGVRFVLFGNAADAPFALPNVVDLRGKTSFLELLAVVRNRCRVLVAPDSGVLTAAYYLDETFPLEVISLWSDPRQGIRKQGCPSPNAMLRHVALDGAREDVRNIAVDTVAAALDRALGAHRTSGPVHAPAH
jgi:ADP-heptose:LPS heptosyltransferase